MTVPVYPVVENAPAAITTADATDLTTAEALANATKTTVNEVVAWIAAQS